MTYPVIPLVLIRPILCVCLSVWLAGFASAARADCYADYKAKQDTPLRLHYGVIALPEPACTREAAAGEIARRIGQGGWTLLTVISIFGEDGLSSRRGEAGDYFLRF